MMKTFAFNILTDRKPEIRGTKPRDYVRQRLAQSAETLSRAGRAAARVEVMNEALCRFTELSYETDPDGVLVNVDPVSHRLRIPAPWGDKGWRVWGLRRWESHVLGAILRARLESFRPGKDRPPLFVYDPAVNYWSVNLEDYQTLQAAGWWLKRSPVTLKEWRQFAETKP
jgi:hypothetical protein